MMDLISILNCKLCLLDCEDLIDITNSTINTFVVAEIIQKHIWLKDIERPETIGNLSEKICNACWNQIETFHIFYMKTKKNFESLLASQSQNNICKEENDKNVAEDDDFIKVEYLYDDNMEIEDDGKEEIEVKLSSEIKPKLSKEEKNNQILLEDEQIRNFCGLKCELCPEQFETFADTKAHYRKIHKQPGYIICCDKKIFKRFIIVQHIMKHVNPEAFKCEECNKIYSDNRTLENHKLSHNSDKPYKCDQCTKCYSKRYLLNHHKLAHTREEDKKFICEVNDCKKAFAIKSLLAFHIRCVHESFYSHMCDICAKVFKTKMNFEQHRLLHTMDPECRKVQCPICNVWVKSARSLRRHIKQHTTIDEEFKCELCGKESPNREALQSHKRYVHINERKFKCTFLNCEKAFKRQIGLKEHMTIHTNEVLYTCTFCPKTFNSSANMLCHRKKMHPVEWEELQRNKV